MTFEEILDQAIAMLQRRGRLTYGTLKRQFQLDDAALEDLKDELIKGQRLAVDEEGKSWSGRATRAPRPDRPATSRHDPGARPAVLHPALSRREDPDLPQLPSKASASRSRCSLPTSKAPPS